MSEIPTAPMERLLRNAGAKRVSNDAAKHFAQVLEDICLDIAKEAVKLSKHAGRKTVKAKDIKLAKR
ncbi:MAG: histone family protein [DPANN group archaeon]|nr:histone family protein [DPANN group archaeon]